MQLHLHRFTLAVLLLVVATSGLAQEDKRASREREALRRTQQALRGAQEQQATLQREKEALAAQKQQLEAAARLSAAHLAGARAQGERARADTDRAAAERDLLRSELEAARAAAATRERAATTRIDELAAALQASHRQTAERTQAVAALSALLERSTIALGDAEAKNRTLYQTGRLMLDELRSLGGGSGFLGFDAIALENRAEALRGELERQRLVDAASR